MYAVMKTGGKQYRVEPGQTLRVEKLEAEEGATVRFDEVLMVGGAETAVGSPLLAGAAVEAEVVAQVKGDKVISFVRRRRKHSSKRTRGHRQRLTVLRVTGIQPSEGAEMVRAQAADAAAADTTLDEVADDAGDDAALEAGDKPQFLSAPREGGADDLTRIKGVGPKLAGILRDIGVHHFDQIAAWTAEEVAYMDARLSFKGRIEREGWIEQAARLAAEPAPEPEPEDDGVDPAALASPVGAAAAATAATAGLAAATLETGAAMADATADALGAGEKTDETDGAAAKGTSEVEATPDADAPAEGAEPGASEAEATPDAGPEPDADADGTPQTKE